MSSGDVIARVKRRKLAHGAQLVGCGVGAIIIAAIIQAVTAATIGLSIVSVPLYIGGGVIVLAGIYIAVKASVEPGDVQILRADAAQAHRAGDTGKAARLERDAEELELAFKDRK